MLAERRNVRQIPGEGFRRWFTDEYFDLIVWYDSERLRITGFQLCYDRLRNERALTWTERYGFSHTGIDDGQVPGSHPASPVLTADGFFDGERVLDRFRSSCREIDPDVAEFVRERLSPDG